MDIRPRTAGEILDDAWGLVFADAPALLALSGLFTVPAAAVLLLLLTLPTELPPFVLPLLAALLLPLTGLGSGACQALFRARAEGRAASTAGCLGEALRRGLPHVALRGVLLLVTWLGVLICVLPVAYILGPRPMFSFVFTMDMPSFLRLLLLLGMLEMAWALAALAGGGMVHPSVAAGTGSWSAAWMAALRQTHRQAGKVAVVLLTRPIVLLFAFVNGLTLVDIGLWAADHLAGFNVALLERVLTPANPVWVLSLGLLSWLLLVPYFEASNYLLHADDRARYEGLDLWYRVRRLFPTPAKSAALILCALFLCSSPARAEQRRDALAHARTEVGRITQEVKDAKNYVSGRPWLEALRSVRTQLERDLNAPPPRFQWFEPLLTEFRTADRKRALALLGDLDRRLSFIEDSLLPEEGGTELTKEQLKALLPDERAEKKAVQRPETRPEPKPPPEPVPDNPPPQRRVAPPRSAGLVTPPRVEGLGTLGWTVLGILFAAVVVFAVRSGWLAREKTKPPPAATKKAADELSLESLLSQPARTLENLWQQADDLARAGKCLEAVRILYLAVLTFLHRNNFIRCAPMRTNGEYLAQLRARQEICRPFRGLTGLFEVKWYGERSCQQEDYAACRSFAETIHEAAKPA